MGLFKEIINATAEYLNRATPKDDSRNLSGTSDMRDPALWYQMFPNWGFQTVSGYYRSTAYACINARAENLAKADIFLQAKQASGKVKEIPSHPFLELISSYNIYNQNWYDLLYYVSVSLDINGRAFWYYKKDFLGRIIQILPLPARNVLPVLNANQTEIEKYEYRYGSTVIDYYPDEVVFFRLPLPNTLFGWLATATACHYALDIDEFQSRYQKNFYINDANISGVLEIPGKINSENVDSLREKWNQKYQGPENNNKIGILDNGMKYQRVQGTPRELDFTNSRKDIAREIMSIFRVHPAILGMTEDVNRANAEMAMRSFLMTTIIPFSKHVFNPVEVFVKTNYDSRLILKADYTMSEDSKEKTERDKMLLQSGIVKGNEMREQYGWDASSEPLMNEHLIPVNYVPASQLTKVQESNAGNKQAPEEEKAAA